jgi:hypothetical protein
MQGQGEGNKDQGHIWTRMMAIAGALQKRTATSYCIVDSLARGQWPSIGEKGAFTWASIMSQFSSLVS